MISLPYQSKNQPHLHSFDEGTRSPYCIQELESLVHSYVELTNNYVSREDLQNKVRVHGRVAIRKIFGAWNIEGSYNWKRQNRTKEMITDAIEELGLNHDRETLEKLLDNPKRIRRTVKALSKNTTNRKNWSFYSTFIVQHVENALKRIQRELKASLDIFNDVLASDYSSSISNNISEGLFLEIIDSSVSCSNFDSNDSEHFKYKPDFDDWLLDDEDNKEPVKPENLPENDKSFKEKLLRILELRQ